MLIDGSITGHAPDRNHAKIPAQASRWITIMQWCHHKTDGQRIGQNEKVKKAGNFYIVFKIDC
jgi:hypothetical protein